MPDFNQSNIENAIESLLALALKSQKNDVAEEQNSHDKLAFSAEDEAALKRFDDDFVNNLIAISRNKEQRAIPHKKPSQNIASGQFQEAILIAALVRALSSPAFPLGRKRYQKISYLVYRKSNYDVRQKFSKKAAGPYDHTMRYKGGEGIAKRNGYIKWVKQNNFEGFVSANNIAAIDEYLVRYDFASSINWAVEQFRYSKNDELELLATVDYASLELKHSGINISAAEIQSLIANEPEWAPKLNRSVFSLTNIQHAIDKLKSCFPNDY